MEFLEDVLLPTIRAMAFPHPEHIFLLQDNNCPVHKCNDVTAWFRDHQEFTVIEWPTRSPDLNPIENLWGIMVKECTDRNERTPDVLERHYRARWESIRRDPELCHQLVQSMRRRMQDCIDNLIKYFT